MNQTEQFHEALQMTIWSPKYPSAIHNPWRSAHCPCDAIFVIRNVRGHPCTTAQMRGECWDRTSPQGGTATCWICFESHAYAVPCLEQNTEKIHPDLKKESGIKVVKMAFFYDWRPLIPIRGVNRMVRRDLIWYRFSYSAIRYLLISQKIIRYDSIQEYIDRYIDIMILYTNFKQPSTFLLTHKCNQKYITWT